MQTSTAISRIATAALTDGSTAKDRHALASPATKRFDAILHVIEIVLRDMPNADPATRVALARLMEVLARIVDFPPQAQESLRDFTRRLATHMDALPSGARALIEKQLNQPPLLAALKRLVETLRPSLRIDLRIDLPLTRDGLWQADAFSAAFPDDDERPAFRQPTIQAPLPTRMAFSQAPGVAPGAPHLQQALGRAFSPEATLRSLGSAAPAPLPRPTPATPADLSAAPPVANAPNGADAAPPTMDEPLPALREATAFLASDAHALAQAVAIARRQTIDIPFDGVAGHAPDDGTWQRAGAMPSDGPVMPELSLQDGPAAPSTQTATAAAIERLSTERAASEAAPAIVRPDGSDMASARTQLEEESQTMSPTIGEPLARSPLLDRASLPARGSEGSRDAARSSNDRGSADVPAGRLDRLPPQVDIAMMTAGAREVANTIAQLDEWETLFYMLSGSLGEAAEAHPPQVAHPIPDGRNAAPGSHPAPGRGVAPDLPAVGNEDRASDALAVLAEGEDAAPAPLPPRGLDIVVAREAIGYPFLPYLPAAAGSEVPREDEEPRREHRDREREFSQSDDGDGDERQVNSPEKDEADAPVVSEAPDRDRHDAYGLYQRLSDFT